MLSSHHRSGPRSPTPSISGARLALVIAALVAPACTTYHAIPRDAGDTGGGTGGVAANGSGGRSGVGGVAGSGGRVGTGGATVDAATPGTGGAPGIGGADAGVDRADAGADRVDAPAVDTGVDLPRDTPPELKANGTLCGAGSECQSRNCVDGVCCESACTGQCQACAEPNQIGKCVTIAGAQRGTVRARCPGQGTCAAVCNGSDALACQYPRSEKQCEPASCAAGMAKVASTCDGAGTCTTVTAMRCASNLCADTTQCAGGCSAAQPCATGQYCEPTTKVCLPLKVNGDVCVQGQDAFCASGMCVDGVCCDAVCSGQCESCAETGNKGHCIAITDAPRGTRRPPCAGTRDACRGTCNGTSRTQCAYPGSNVTCVPASCTAGSLTMASVCNSLGDCTIPPPATSCRSGQCSSTPGQCLICTAGLACGGGLVCDVNGGVCCPAGQGACGGVTCVDVSSTPQHCGASCIVCGGATPRCASGTCVQCVIDQDCGGSTPSCNPATHTCTCRRPSFGNLFQNPGFEAPLGLGGWDPGTVVVTNVPATWSSEDSDGCSGSGSAHAVNTSATGGPNQCVQVSPGTRYFFGARFKGTDFSFCQAQYFLDTSCGAAQGEISTEFISSTGSSIWFSSSTSLTAPAGVKSLLIYCFMINTSVDQLYLNSTSNSY